MPPFPPAFPCNKKQIAALTSVTQQRCASLHRTCTISENSYEVLEYVYGLLENGAAPDSLSAGEGAGVAYHSHCPQLHMV